MRYITLNQLQPGMTIGKPFYDHLGSILLQSGTVLTQTNIDRLHEKQYSGVYVDDDISKDIEIADVVSGELKNRVSQAARRLITNIDHDRDDYFDSDMKHLSAVLYEVIDEIMSSKATVVNIIDIKEYDQYTYQHSVNVCILSCVLGSVFHMSKSEMYDLALAAILHDIGKLLVDKNILNKPSVLTDVEFDAVRRHPLHGYNILKSKSKMSGAVLFPILQHHEKYDGKGYLEGKRGRDISLNAQIISVTDVYDAITSKRPYHDPILPSEAYELIMGNAGKAFDYDIVNVFTKKIAPFPLGMQVQLSNGAIGIVCKNYGDLLTRPLIRLNPIDGSKEFKYLDLRNDSSVYNVTIEKVFL